jgi:hypothetical protein
MFVYRLYITSLEAGSWHIRARDLVRKKLGTFEENSTVSCTKLLRCSGHWNLSHIAEPSLETDV